MSYQRSAGRNRLTPTTDWPTASRRRSPVSRLTRRALHRQAPGTALASTHAYGWHARGEQNDSKRRPRHFKDFPAPRQPFNRTPTLGSERMGHNRATTTASVMVKRGRGVDAKVHSMLFVSS